MSITDAPLTTFAFEVVFQFSSKGGAALPRVGASFAEVDGLEMSMQQKTIEAGGLNTSQIHRMGPVTFANLTFKRGLTQDLGLWNWFTVSATPGSQLMAAATVTMWAADHTPAIQFTVTGCLPIKLRAPALNARDGLVAIEELTVVYETLTIGMPGSSVGSGT